ncbi:bifunctional riboflavin kinase/FAD synthetase [Paenibacillus albiflavus]|uniref:Riboflavin biosynthesis protein n=1 Tax=Paenibacillus albiflavus TaxID=2545760 RepID=A0A4R4ENR7_9BACL|nr:bifunctional riboflavin kinase/FAD synthetase [Paenibacillus albiflavus]TCZ80008.1 bifunctional riboflavin kinase/FAD synthetase [Paenibacillus albiflavus]
MDVISLTHPFADKPQGPSGKQVIAIGEFDGVHRGHQEVIAKACSSAKAAGCELALMTFDPHPRKVIGIEGYDQLLAPVPLKLELFDKLGVDRTYLVTFNDNLMRLSASEFVERILIPLEPETIIVGFDFRFGHRAEGNVDTLCELSKGRFAVQVVRPYLIEGAEVKISSSAIRTALSEGDVKTANQLLGRAYSIQGEVIHGDARGRTIGFRTANLQLQSPYLIPRYGVYAVRVELNGNIYNGVMNIGVKPTFQTGELKLSLEVHILDFSEDIYGQQLKVELIDFIRGEQKFSSIEELIKEIQANANTARSILSSISK